MVVLIHFDFFNLRRLLPLLLVFDIFAMHGL